MVGLAGNRCIERKPIPVDGERFRLGIGADEGTRSKGQCFLTLVGSNGDAYADGVSMCLDLPVKETQVPKFFVWATRDTLSAPLQGLQIIKGWTLDGEHHKQVYNGAKVNLADCSFTKNIGSTELKTVWRDPDFNPEVRAFYYARLLQNPTCR